MWIYVALVLLWLVLIFGYVVLFGAPYLPTLSKQKKAAFDLLDLQAGQTLLELGSGDGRMLKAAAQKGIKAIGFELNPLLALFSYLFTWKYRDNVRIIWGNYWWHIWPRADGIYVFLIDRYMKKLDKKIIQNYPEHKVRLASFAFKVPDKEVVKEKNGVYLYNYLPKSDN